MTSQIIFAVAAAAFFLVSTANSYVLSEPFSYNAKLKALDAPNRQKSQTRSFSSRNDGTYLNTVTYDLGIGKNAAVKNKKNARENEPILSSFRRPQTTYQACLYFIEHQAVREYPPPKPPILVDSYVKPEREQVGQGGTTSSKTQPSQKNRRIQYHRCSEDVLEIMESPKSRVSMFPYPTKPAMVAHTSLEKLNVNTPWVEMLMHCENQRLATT